jgi:hypothetical protein
LTIDRCYKKYARSLLSGSAAACVPRTGKNEPITARTIVMKGAKS